MNPTRPHAPRPSADQSELIDALGGPTEVATLLLSYIGYLLSPQSVSMWRRRGIPFRYRAPLAIEARERGISVPTGFLGETAREPKRVDA